MGTPNPLHHSAFSSHLKRIEHSLTKVTRSAIRRETKGLDQELTRLHSWLVLLVENWAPIYEVDTKAFERRIENIIETLDMVTEELQELSKSWWQRFRDLLGDLKRLLFPKQLLGHFKPKGFLE